ncbi:hypothetical protein [Bdellovibrio sp. HCB337]|uniref:hypothetical protein n=1 Tax=Bdellovibrio sp. HCB337 TaxID=3394358 RepID=UPI0039A5CDA4
MDNFILALVALVVFFIWYMANGKKLQARIERIRRIHGRLRGPDARIGYMNLKGKRYTWQITIETVQPKGKDWIVTAWCHEKNDFLVFHASRMYEYFDLNALQEIKNVPAYFSERFDRRKLSRTV